MAKNEVFQQYFTVNLYNQRLFRIQDFFRDPIQSLVTLVMIKLYWSTKEQLKNDRKAIVFSYILILDTLYYGI